MTRRIPFYGPAATGLRDGSGPGAGDLLDLFDERIYRTRWPDDPYELQFAGIAALIVCCGAWPEEIPLIETADIAVKNVPPGANLDPALPADNGIWLGRGDYRRRVWVPEVARMVLARVVGRIAPAPGCNRLFVRRDGTPMNGKDVLSRFKNLSGRVGLGSGQLTTQILFFFEDCASKCGDPLAEAFLARRLAEMRRARALGGVGEPTLAQMRKAVERAGHPLARLTRDILQHVRPLERAYPDRAFRKLRPETLAEIEAAKGGRGKCCYPPELAEAVFAATAAGRHEFEIAAHYGIPVTSVGRLLKARRAGYSSQRLGMGPRTYQAAFVAHARRHPHKTASEHVSWMAARLGVRTNNNRLTDIARRKGVKLAHPIGALRNGRDPKRVEAHIRNHPEQTIVDAQSWAKNTLRRDLSRGVLYSFARSRGLRFATLFKLVGEKAERLEAYIRANPDADIAEVVVWIERELKMAVDIEAVRGFLRRRSLKVRNRPKGKPAPYERQVLAWIKANPDAEFGEALAWLNGDAGMSVAPETLRAFLRSRSIRLRPGKQGPKAPYERELLAWIEANPGATNVEALAWLKDELGIALNRKTLGSFLRNRSIRLCPDKGGPKASYGPALLTWIEVNPNASFGDGLAWLKDELGVAMPAMTLRSFLKRHGITLRSSKSNIKAPYGAALLAWAERNPDAEIDEALTWLKDKLGMSVEPNTLWAFARRNGLKLRARRPGPKVSYETKLLAWIGENPDAQFDQVIAWLAGELGTAAPNPEALRTFLQRRGIKLRRSKGGPKASYGPALLTWIEANPNAAFGDTLAWLKNELGIAMPAQTLRSFLKSRGIVPQSPKRSSGSSR
ncbi:MULTISPECIES: hypothetical protein [unclassified Bradyrhizobium]|uniref:hypothetical protein n=1 Tax=unclassified Bradyrhizobium TaxID=2631580 RepID=UPI002FF03C3E